MEKEKEFKCNACKKFYKNYKSLWKHNHIYHRQITDEKVSQNQILVSQKVSQKKNDEIDYPCRFCNKVYLHKQSRHSHEKKCKIIDDNKAKDAVKLKELEEKLNEQSKLIKELMSKSNDAKTINNNNNNGTIINNNIHINALGYESINDKLTEQEKINLLTCHIFKESPCVELVRYIYKDDKFIEDRNTMISNLQNKSCLVYNNKTKKFEAKNKNQHIDNLIDFRKKDIKELYESVRNNKKISKKYGKKIESRDEEVIESNKKDKEEIIYIIYNNKEQMKEIKEKLDRMENNTDDEEDDLEEESDEEDNKSITV